MNQTSIEVGLQDVFNIHKKDMFLSLNCHAIGQVTKFNSEDQTVEVQINYSKRFFVADEKKEGLRKEVIREYPLLIDCPAVVLTGGDSGLTMPIKAGDDCLLMFNDRDIDNWFSGSTKGPVQSGRLHSMADAIALVGVRSLKKSLENYDTNNPVLFNKNAKMTVKTDKFLIENSIETLNGLLQELITQVKAITTVGSATNQAVSPASQVLLTSVATRIGSLLE